MSGTENNPFPTLRSSPGGGQVTTPRLSPSVCSHFMIHHAQPSPAQRRPQRSDRAVPWQEENPRPTWGTGSAQGYRAGWWQSWDWTAVAGPRD